MTLLTVVTAFSIYLILIHASTVANSAMDPYKALNIILNPNGTLTRLSIPPQSPPSPDPSLPTPVLSKDLPINKFNHTWARIYLPHKALHHSPNAKLPLIVFYHGGGFVFDSAASTYFHDFCVRMTNATQSVVVSVDYRLAPEHRLPAAYEDSVEALHWIKASNDAWLRHADYSRCYLMGESAGGNIAYTAGLRAAAEVDKLKPLKIKGLILIQPFFGGRKRSPSEIRLAEDTTIPLPITDLMWNLSLPVGADRDHPYSNPFVNGGDKILDEFKVYGWRVAVFGCEGDPLVDRERELVKLLEQKGVHVVGKFYEGGRHGIFVGDPSMSVQVFRLLKTLH
ncbi:carboxylesterase 1-like [Vigna unguiculata]|uniref:Gibberellin receptor GID1 n=1 Tax=Vigna unguiculata TaxID=3917 RepID=A0A4D6N5W8_VIGUN|nr:carboxylesterase 1-like [Vigna unguiculata]QCE08261.1 gibberellin receptor GID1 [Vigna unguiculata]